ncbi:MAG: hydroxymethylglutaryl-CoA lyase, partial [Burkholderiaceae bacterium]
MALPKFVYMTEVGPRDGLQNEQSLVPVGVKVGLCERLIDAGVNSLEVTSFVSPRKIPQMADAREVMARVMPPLGGPLGVRRQGKRIAVLTPNMKGFDAALDAGATEVVIFGAASEAFSQ